MNRHGSVTGTGLFIIATVLLALPAAATGTPGVRIIASDSRMLELEITPSVEITRLEHGEILPHIGGATISNSGNAGAPMQMNIRIPLALPAPTGNSFEILSVEYDAPMSGRIAPVPSQSVDAQGLDYLSYTIRPDEYARPAVNGAVAELRYTGIARDLHVGAIVVQPYRVDQSAGTIRFLKSIRLRVRYGATVPVDGRRESLSLLTRGMFLNSAAAVNWSIHSASRSVLARRSAASSARAWMRVEVQDEGLYALTGGDFRKGGIDLATVDPGRIVVYGGDGGDLPERVSMADSNRMLPIPTIIERDGNGRASRVLFYATGPLRWTRSPNDTLPVHTLSPYINARSYIVAVDGEPSVGFPQQQVTGSPTVSISSAMTSVVNDEERINIIGLGVYGPSGRSWFGTSFITDGATGDTRSFTTSLPGLDRAMPLQYRIRVASGSEDTDGVFSFMEGSAAIGSPVMLTARGEHIVAAARAQRVAGDANTISSDNVSTLRISYSCVEPATGWLDYYEIHYGRRLQLESSDHDQIVFYSPSGAGVGEYRVTGFGGDDIVGFDVTDPAAPVQLVPISRSGGAFVFRDQLHSVGEQRRYLVTRMGSVHRTDAVLPAAFGDLRNRMLNADILVITHPDLIDAAKKYVAYRNSQGRYSAAYVTTDEIYTEFSHGTLDPIAMRDYIYFAYHNWTRRPTFVLLLGDGNYDYRNLVTKQPQLVPPYETDDGDIYDDVNSVSVDDYYVRVDNEDDNGPLPDLAIGRIPVETVEQANTVIEKIRRYENDHAFGTWKSTIILAADDALPVGQGSQFVAQSETAWHDYVPSWMEPRKIYLPAYPLVGGTKPASAQDLLDDLNRGALMMNWIGHGNPDVLAHEGLFEQHLFLPKLYNDSMPVFITAPTCNFAQFDNPERVSSAESLLRMEKGGAIALVASSRAVLIDGAKYFIWDYYGQLFRRDPLTTEYPVIGQALFQLKDHNNDATAEKFTILGDPAMALQFPQDSVSIEEVDGQSIADTVATVRALSMVTVKGTVRSQKGDVRSDFNGTAIITLFDADRHLSPVSAKDTQNMILYGGRLYRGPATVTNGHFTASFRVPKDITFDTTTGRLHIYAFNEASDAAGMTANVRIYGSDTATITDLAGPNLDIFLDDRSFRSGDMVTRTPLLIVDLADTSGINSSGSGLGHHIEGWIDDDTTPMDLSDNFQTLPTDYGRGTIERRLLDIEPGEHRIRIRAWDIYNNVTEGMAYFRIAGEGDSVLHVEQVVNYPNPMSRETDFTFRHNQTLPLDVQIAIYTPSGRKIQQLEKHGITDRFVRMHWNGTDSDGHPVANGVYLYRLRVNIADESDGKAFEVIESLAITR